MVPNAAVAASPIVVALLANPSSSIMTGRGTTTVHCNDSTREEKIDSDERSIFVSITRTV